MSQQSVCYFMRTLIWIPHHIKDQVWGHAMLVIPALGGCEKGWSLGFGGHWFSRTIEFRVQWETLFQENKAGSDWERYPASVSGWLRKIPSISICPPCSHKWTYIHMHIHTLLASLCTCAFIPASLSGSMTCTFKVKVRIWDRYSLPWSCSISATTRLTSGRNRF